MFKAIIIDDVEQARKTLLQDILDYCPEVEVIGEASGVVEGAKVLKQLKPDLVFLDIQMQDGSGFDLLEIVKEEKLKVIFTTASDAHAIKAFRFSAIDYLMKPIDPDELKQAVSKLNQNIHSSKSSLEMLSDSLKLKNRKQEKLALHTLEKIHVVNISDIIRCEANANYTEFFFSNNKKMLVTKTMKDFEEMLSEHDFYRVHHSHLVNTKYIKEFIKADGGYIVMNDNSNIPVSSRKKHDVMRMIEGL
jgi:two-component system LytT family response regulator